MKTKRIIGLLALFAAAGCEDFSQVFHSEIQLIFEDWHSSSETQNGTDERFCTQPSDCLAYSWTVAPVATQHIEINANLDESSSVPYTPWDMSSLNFDPGLSSNFSTAILVYDSSGNGHRVDFYFAKSSEHVWVYYAVCDAGELSGGVPGDYFLAGDGELAFTEDGHLYSETVTSDIVFNFIGASAGQIIEVDFGDSIVAGGAGQNGTTGYAASCMVRTQWQDGRGDDSQGNWRCEENLCVQNFETSFSNDLTGTCGDGLCSEADGESTETCQYDCFD